MRDRNTVKGMGRHAQNGPEWLKVSALVIYALTWYPPSFSSFSGIILNENLKSNFNLLIAQDYSFQVQRDKNYS